MAGVLLLLGIVAVLILHICLQSWVALEQCPGGVVQRFISVLCVIGVSCSCLGPDRTPDSFEEGVFSPRRLRETFVASVYVQCCRLCEDLGLHYQFKACLFRGLAACWCFCLWHLMLLASESWNALIQLQFLGSIQQCLGRAWEPVVN